MDRPDTTRTIERPATGADAHPDGDACLNCGAPLSGPYCSECGQRHSPTARPLRRVLADWAEEVASLDSRLLRTLGRLFFRPGRLTVDYNAGRRVRYASPVRLYMVASVIFFFAVAFAPGMSAGVSVSGEGTAVGVTADAVADDRANATAPAADADDAGPSGFDEWVRQQAEHAAEDQAGFTRFWLRVMAWSMFVLLPVTALLLALLYRRPNRYYVEHLVFTLHAHAFAFILLSTAIGLWRIWPDTSAYGLPLVVAFGWVVVYLFLALRRVYGDGIPRTAVKLVVLGTAYSIALTTVMMGSIFVALGLF